MDGWYNAAHNNHIHMDNSLEFGPLDTSSESTVKFVQAVCNNFNGASLTINGNWSQTQAAFNSANSAMGFTPNALTSSTAWAEWCAMIAKHGFRDKALGFYIYPP